MQTFLPFADFTESASVLDYRRLGKQRIEARQILNAIENQTGWKHHPIVKMWTGYESSLKLYHNTVIIEWIRRGYTNNMPLLPLREQDLKIPNWIGKEEFHSSHSAALLFKDFDFYSKYGWEEDPGIDYKWYA